MKMKDYIGICIPANWYRGVQIENGEMEFRKTGICFYSPSMLYHKEKVEIDYSEIIWIEEKKYKIKPNKIIIYTKKNEEYTFVVNECDDVVDFLNSKVKYATEKPMDYKERLHNMTGEKVKRQYFNVPLYMLLSFLLPTPIIISIYDIVLSKDGITQYTPIDIFEGFIIICIWLTPLFLLSLANRFLFGRIVCVLNKEGVHYEQGFIPWEKITNIEYEIEIPSRSSCRKYCFARVLGDGLDVKLMHAPYYFTRKAQKYNNKIKSRFSKGSRFLIVLWATMPWFCYIVVLLIKA